MDEQLRQQFDVIAKGIGMTVLKQEHNNNAWYQSGTIDDNIIETARVTFWLPTNTFFIRFSCGKWNIESGLSLHLLNGRNGNLMQSISSQRDDMKQKLLEKMQTT